jgi:hypothetical protein
VKRKPPVKKQAAAIATDFREEINPNAFANLKRTMLIIIAAFSFLLYANALNHDYAVDDGTVMQNNKIVKKRYQRHSRNFLYPLPRWFLGTKRKHVPPAFPGNVCN